MAQLRDAQTSALLYEGTPAQVAAAAQNAPNDVIFDDVGEAFDPALVLQQHEESVAALHSIDENDQADAQDAQLEDARQFDTPAAVAEARGG